MKRKVIQLAEKTLVVSIPSKWVKKLGIKKGDELEVEEKDNKITISAKKDISADRITVNVKLIEDRSVIRWTISAIQKSGYDEIEIIYEKPETAGIIHELVKDLFVGFAITEQSRSRCVIRSIAKELETEFETMLRRAFLVTLSMGESLADYLKLGKNKELQELLTLEQTNNQLTNFCERLLIKHGYNEQRKTSFAYIIVWNLEKVCDSYKSIICHCSSKKDNHAEIAKLVEANTMLLRLFYDLYFKFDNEKLDKAAALKIEIEENAKQLIKNDPIAISMILQQLNQLSSFSASLIALNT